MSPPPHAATNAVASTPSGNANFPAFIDISYGINQGGAGEAARISRGAARSAAWGPGDGSRHGTPRVSRLRGALLLRWAGRRFTFPACVAARGRGKREGGQRVQAWASAFRSTPR